MSFREWNIMGFHGSMGGEKTWQLCPMMLGTWNLLGCPRRLVKRFVSGL